MTSAILMQSLTGKRLTTMSRTNSYILTASKKRPREKRYICRLSRPTAGQPVFLLDAGQSLGVTLYRA